MPRRIEMLKGTRKFNVMCSCLFMSVIVLDQNISHKFKILKQLAFEKNALLTLAETDIKTEN